MAPSSVGPGKKPRRHEGRTRSNGIGEYSSSTEQWKDVPRGTMDEVSSFAHRVAHLVVNGVDPHRIALLTFSRRAAEEMIRRVERITTAAVGARHIDLPWSGTFHAVGARLLREFANHIGLKPSFTILDRSDAADLMNLVRHELGQSKTKERF